jgi:hypothetical protein
MQVDVPKWGAKGTTKDGSVMLFPRDIVVGFRQDHGPSIGIEQSPLEFVSPAEFFISTTSGEFGPFERLDIGFVFDRNYDTIILPPCEPGFYWARWACVTNRHKEPMTVEVYESPQGLRVLLTGRDEDCPLNRLDFLSGKLTPPVVDQENP